MRQWWWQQVVGVPRRPLLWVTLVGLSVMSVIDLVYSHIVTSDVERVSFLVVAMCKASVLYYVCLAVKPHKALRRICTALIVLLGVLSLANLVGAATYGIGISRRLIAVVAETNGRETMEFLPQFIATLPSAVASRYVVTTVALCCVAGALAWLLPRRAFSVKVALWLAMGLVVCGAYSTRQRAWGKLNLSLFARVVSHGVGYCKEMAKLDELMAHRKPFPDAGKVHSEQRCNVVMVIGESALREHHSLYGYPLRTTPHLDAMAADSLCVFTNVIGSSQSTNDNLTRILTFRRDCDFDEWYNHPSIVEMFKIAGYRTFWLSNQEKTGGNCSAAIAGTADVVNYVGTYSYNDNLSYGYDERLLAPFARAMASGYRHKFVMCHLLGSHVQYRLRFPSSMAHFTADTVMRRLPRPYLTREKAQTVADYDNSIRYTDSILAQMIGIVSKVSTPTVLIYFSDHGEMVYDGKDFNGRCRESVTVPMVAYANGPFRARYPQMMRAFAAARHLPLSSANMVYALMTLTGTSYPLYDATRDFLSPRFVKRPRYVDESRWDK